jgi:hypothetical protein
MALREAINADRNDGFNVTEHRSAPASVGLIAATKVAQSMLERARADREECATVAENGAHHGRHGIKRAADKCVAAGDLPRDGACGPPRGIAEASATHAQQAEARTQSSSRPVPTAHARAIGTTYSPLVHEVAVPLLLLVACAGRASRVEPAPRKHIAVALTRQSSTRRFACRARRVLSQMMGAARPNYTCSE